MNIPTFKEFPKIFRYSREAIVTEKIDGTNASVYIEVVPEHEFERDQPGRLFSKEVSDDDGDYYHCLWAGARNNWITPLSDNYGFAQWVLDNREDLMRLGPGAHFGEWWGAGIQRNYGLTNGDKRFSLFNVTRWHPHGSQPHLISQENPKAAPKYSEELPACCGLVPIIRRGILSSQLIDDAMVELSANGSIAAPGFRDPEGIVIFHVPGNLSFKKTFSKDEEPKGK